jgi:hypothetical protein
VDEIPADKKFGKNYWGTNNLDESFRKNQTVANSEFRLLFETAKKL